MKRIVTHTALVAIIAALCAGPTWAQKFVHITDLHISTHTDALPAVGEFDRDGRNFTILRDSIVAENPAFVICTGDIVNSGIKDDGTNDSGNWMALRDKLYPNGNTLYMKRTGTSPYYTYSIPVYFVPGNHDSRRRSQPGITQKMDGYDTYIGKGTVAASGCTAPKYGAVGDTARDFYFTSNNMLFIGLNSGRDGEIGQDPNPGNPEGTGLTAAQRTFISNKCAANPGKIKIIALHHPGVNPYALFNRDNYGTDYKNEPFDGLFMTKDDGTFIGAGTFRATCADNNVALVLAGHLHQNVVLDSFGYKRSYSNATSWTQSAGTGVNYVQTAEGFNGAYRVINVTSPSTYIVNAAAQVQSLNPAVTNNEWKYYPKLIMQNAITLVKIVTGAKKSLPLFPLIGLRYYVNGVEQGYIPNPSSEIIFPLSVQSAKSTSATLKVEATNGVGTTTAIYPLKVLDGADAYYDRLNMGSTVNVTDPYNGHVLTFKLADIDRSAPKAMLSVKDNTTNASWDEFIDAGIMKRIGSNSNLILYAPRIFYAGSGQFIDVMIAPYQYPSINIMSPSSGQQTNKCEVRLSTNYSGNGIAWSNATAGAPTVYGALKTITWADTNTGATGTTINDYFTWDMSSGTGPRTLTVKLKDAFGTEVSKSVTVTYNSSMDYLVYRGEFGDKWQHPTYAEKAYPNFYFTDYPNSSSSYKTIFWYNYWDGSNPSGTHSNGSAAAHNKAELIDIIANSMAGFSLSQDAPSGSTPVYVVNRTEYSSGQVNSGRLGTITYKEIYDRLACLLGRDKENRYRVWTSTSPNRSDAAPIPDASNPSAVIVNPAGATAYVNTNYLKIEGTARDDVNVKYVELSINGGATWIKAAGTTSWSGDIQFPSEGSYTLDVRATDDYNKTSALVKQTIVYDITPCNLTVSEPASGTSVASASIRVTGTASDTKGVANVKVKVNNGNWVQTVQKANWSLNVDLEPGLNIITAQATDSAGNIKTVSVNVSRCTGFSDDFNRADGAPGNNWSVGSGSATISGNQLALGTTTVNPRLVRACAAQNNLVVTVDFNYTRASSQPMVAIRSPNSSWYDGYGWRYNNGFLYIYDSGIDKIRVALTLSANAWYASELSVNSFGVMDVRIWNRGAARPASATLSWTGSVSSNGGFLKLSAGGDFNTTDAYFDNFFLAEVPANNTIFADNFDRANGPPAGCWTLGGGTVSIDGNQLLLGTNANGVDPRLEMTGARHNNLVMTVDFSFAQTSSRMMAAVRSPNSSWVEGYGWLYYNSNLYIYDNSAVKTNVGLNLSVNTWYTAEMSIKSTNAMEVRIWARGSARPASATLAWTGTPIANGNNWKLSAGGNSNTSQGKFDNFTVTDFTSGSTSFSDDFNRANGAPGNGWTYGAGTMAVEGNMLVMSTGGADPRLLRSGCANNIVMTVDFCFKQALSRMMAAVRSPNQSWIDGYGWLYYDKKLYIYDNEAVKTNVGLTLSANAWYTAEMTINLSDVMEVRIWPQGSVRPCAATLSWTGAPASSGNNWKLSAGGDYNTCQGCFDNFSVGNAAPVGYWPLNQTSGLVAYDYSGSGNNGTISGAFWDDGQMGKALRFDGVDDYVNCGNNASLNIGAVGQSYSVSAWFKTSVLSDQSISEKWPLTGGTYPYCLRGPAGGGAGLRFAAFDGTNNPCALDASQNYADGAWHHAVGVRDVAADMVRLYVDGALKSEVTDNTVGNLQNTANIAIGRRHTDFQNCQFNGLIDDVRIYNRTLSFVEIRSLYDRGTLVGHWKLDETAGPTAFDESGNGNNGTLNGYTSNPWEYGQMGNALSFDGVDDYVYVNNIPLITGNAVTVSCWVNLQNATSQPYEFISTNAFILYVYNDPTQARVMMRARVGQGEAEYPQGASPFSYNAWHHLVGVYDGQKIMNYVDGVLAASAPLTGSMSSVGYGLKINGRGLHKGKVDEVRIYNKALSAAEISNMYAQAIGDGLYATYYNNMDFTGTTISRIDGTVNFDWGASSPDPSIGSDTYSARWIGKIKPYFSETYIFYTISDDGIRLWVDGVLIIDNWTDHGSTENSGAITLTAGQKYDIMLEYYENGGSAVASLSWSSPSQSKEIVPQSRLYSYGKSIDAGSIPVLKPQQRLVTKLLACAPNPFSGQTAINFQLAKPAKTTIKVYNIMGQQVETLVNECLQPGYHSVKWDGKSDKGQKVAAGVYLYRMQAGDYSKTNKLTVLR